MPLDLPVARARSGSKPPTLAVLACLVLAASGCRSKPDLSSITLGVRADITGVYPNPPIVNEGFTIWINMQIFEGLSGLDSDMRAVPALAEGWETPDDTSYIFYLRPGIRFSDGRPLTPADVAASLNAAIKRAWVTSDSLQAIEAARALDDRRVEIRTRTSQLALPNELPRGFVLPAAALERDPIPTIGTGPYRMESWQPGREFVLVRNAYHRGRAPDVQRGRFLIVPDGNDRVRRLLTGELQVAEQVPLDRLGELERDARVRVYHGSGNRLLFLGLRVASGPLGDARVREAIDLALDRREISRRVYDGRAEAASQMIHPSVVGYDPAAVALVPDRALARRLLAQAGFAGGLDLRLDGPSNRYVRDIELLAEVARQLAEVGIRVKVSAADKTVFFRRLEARDSSFYLIGWSFETGEAGGALSQLFHTAQGGVLGTSNYTGLSDPELDRLIDQAGTSRSESERAELLRKAARLAAVHRAAIPLVIQPEAVAMSRHLEWHPPLNYALRLGDFRVVRD